MPADHISRALRVSSSPKVALTNVIPELLPLPSSVEGPRIRLRPFRRGDGPDLFAAVDEGRAHLSKWLPWVDRHKSVIDSEVYVRKAQAWWILREDLPLAIEDKTSNRILGGTGLHRFDWAIRSFEIGYWVKKSAAGQGYVTEAVRILTALAFERLDAQRVEIRCDPANERSASVPRRLGFTSEARLPSNARTPSGEPRDTLVFAATRPTFDSLPWASDALKWVRRSDAEG